MIYKLCQKYSQYEDIQDLMQESYFGLMDAIERYDSTKGKFMTYAEYWILNRIRQYIKSCCAPVHVASWMHDRILKYYSIVNDYYNIYKRKPTDFEICGLMNISTCQLKILKRTIVILSTTSIDKPINTETDSVSLRELIPDDHDQYQEIDDDFDKEILKKDLWTEVDALDPAEINVIYKRYQDNQTTQEISNAIGLSVGAIKNVEIKALRKLRRSKVLKSYEEDYSTSKRFYMGGLQSFKITHTSITEKIAIDRYERLHKTYP